MFNLDNKRDHHLKYSLWNEKCSELEQGLWLRLMFKLQDKPGQKIGNDLEHELRDKINV